MVFGYLSLVVFLFPVIILLPSDVQTLNFLPCPGCFPQELEAGLHRRIVVETPDIDEYT